MSSPMTKEEVESVQATLDFLEERFGNSEGLDWFDSDAGAVGELLRKVLAAHESLSAGAMGREDGAVAKISLDFRGYDGYIGFEKLPALRNVRPGTHNLYLRPDPVVLEVTDSIVGVAEKAYRNAVARYQTGESDDNAFMRSALNACRAAMQGGKG